MSAWHRAGIYKTRPVDTNSVDEIRQYHIVDIEANGCIRHKINEKEKAVMITTSDTATSYVKAEPNELYPNTKRVGIPGMSSRHTPEKHNRIMTGATEIQINDSDLPKTLRETFMPVVETELRVFIPNAPREHFITITHEGREVQKRIYI
jgi:hypothetical protein